jgi:hypothetical protein
MNAQQPVPHPTFEDRDGNTWYRWKDTLVQPFVADIYRGRKALTAPELAAEYWKCMSGLYDGHGKAARIRRDTIYRFAALPHASDSDYR